MIKDNERGHYELTYSTEISSKSLAVDENDEDLRIKITGMVSYTLSSVKTGVSIATGSLSKSISYSKAASSVADDAMRRNVTDELLAYLAGELVEEINMATH